MTNTDNDEVVNNSRVFIANVGMHDYTQAQRFGKLVAVTRNRVDIQHSDRLEGDVQQALSTYTDEDYILLSGAPIINILCVGYIFRKFGRVRVIYWDSLLKDYTLRVLDFSERKNEISDPE